MEWSDPVTHGRLLVVLVVWTLAALAAEFTSGFWKGLRSRSKPACESCSWWLEGRRERPLGICRLEISLEDTALKGRRPTTTATDFCQRYERRRN